MGRLPWVSGNCERLRLTAFSWTLTIYWTGSYIYVSIHIACFYWSWSGLVLLQNIDTKLIKFGPNASENELSDAELTSCLSSFWMVMKFRIWSAREKTVHRHFSHSGLSGCCRYLLCIFIQVLIVLSLFHWCLIMGNGICALSLYCVCVTWYAFHINNLNISEINQLWSRFMEAGRRNHHWFHLSASIDSFTPLALIWINFTSSGKKKEKKRCSVWKNSKGRSSGWDGILFFLLSLLWRLAQKLVQVIIFYFA